MSPLVDDEFVSAGSRGLENLRHGRVRLDLVSQPVYELLEQLPVAGAAMAPDLYQ